MSIKHLTAVNEEIAMENWPKVILDKIACQRLAETEGLPNFAGKVDYFVCYTWLTKWLNSNIRGKYFGQLSGDGLNFAFSRASEAVRFKLTFGGQ
jgi:hypothetical protein